MKKNYLNILILSISFIILLFFSCQMQGGSSGGGGGSTITYTDVTDGDTYSDTGDEFFFIDTTGYVNLEYTLTGLTGQDVYFIFTNTSTSYAASNPTVSSSYITPLVNKNKYQINKNNISKLTSKPIALRGKPEITEFNNNFYKNIINKKPLSSYNKNNSFIPPKPLKDTVGTSVDFMYSTNPSDTVTATCRSVITVDGTTLNIYVAEDCWETGGTKSYNVTQGMVDTLRDRFLWTGADNDIYEWGTDIFGDQWGYIPDGSGGEPDLTDTLIPSNTQITILLYDIDNDDSPGGVCGFFWSKDNLLNSYLTSIGNPACSNQRVMFYLDAVTYACDVGGWDINDPWPQEMISVLAHEFQHMIHFYQKTVLQTGGIYSETWLNEMCSLVAEDLLARDINLGGGPRAVDCNDGSAGGINNTEGRLPWYNVFNDESVNIFYNDSGISYGVAYAFGAYLARNYGGAPLFRNIVQNAFIDQQAVVNATGESFGTLLKNWGVAALLSDNDDPVIPDTPYEYNISGFFSDNLGSINLFNYIPPPNIYSTSPVGAEFYPTLNRASNRYYIAGIALNGDFTWTVKLANNVNLTVVVKD